MTQAATVAPPQKPTFLQQVREFPANFWFANFMEILERLAFFGSRAVAPLFLVATAQKNGLGLNYDEKGEIYTVWALLQCLIPMVSGGYTDRYGYRKSLMVAFTLNIIGYLGMAQSRALTTFFVEHGWAGAGYWVFMAATCFVATGTAIFKPPVQGTVAKAVGEQTASMGWGVFYWVVNIGGAIAPMAAAKLRGEINWHYVFYAAAIVTACNFLPALLLYREPAKSPLKEGEVAKGPIEVFTSSILTIVRDLRLLVFLLIVSCFWLMFMQLFDLLSNFIDEWVDTSDVARFFGWLSKDWILKSGQTKPEMIVNIDAIAIVLFCLPLSWLVGKVSKLTAMMIGMLISLVTFVISGATQIGWLCCLMIFIFAIGEMICSPTFNAYVGLIAPKDKKALYMGYSNIPFAIGWAAGSKIAGKLYQHLASKFELARQYMVVHFHMDPTVVLDKAKLPEEHVMPTLARVMDSENAGTVQQGIQQFWAGAGGAKVPADRIDAAFANLLGPIEPASIHKATQVLWDLHHPYMVWVYLGVIGLAGTLGMIVFYLVTKARQTQSAPDPTAP